MDRFSVHVDARPMVWGDSSEFFDATERGRGPKSKIIAGKEHDLDEMIPESQRGLYHHREWRHIQDHTTVGKPYQVYWVHGRYVDAGHATTKKRAAHFESWFLIVDDTGQFMDVPAASCATIKG